MTMTRKQFLQSVLGVGAGAVALAACGGDDGGGTPIDAPPSNTCTTPANQISGNHGHTLTVSLDDVNAAAEKTYDITGGADHPHMLTITATQFGQIKNGQTLNITSTSGGGHTHTVTVMCVS